jgi:hypothetical protein
MNTLGEPVYEVRQDSQWHQDKKQQYEDIQKFFKTIKEKYGLEEGFGFYHADYFGIHSGTKAFDTFKNELVKNPTEDGDFYPFKKRSTYFKEIKELIQQIKWISPFKSHDVFGTNNVTASQWIGDRWFFQVKNVKEIKGEEVIPLIYKDYLKIVVDSLD